MRQLENVLVFSQRGARPESCLMSGGDLDGDLYFVIWDDALVPHDEDAPLDYTPARKPVELHGRALYPRALRISVPWAPIRCSAGSRSARCVQAA